MTANDMIWNANFVPVPEKLARGPIVDNDVQTTCSNRGQSEPQGNTGLKHKHTITLPDYQVTSSPAYKLPGWQVTRVKIQANIHQETQTAADFLECLCRDQLLCLGQSQCTEKFGRCIDGQITDFGQR